mmetsp:Transcript_31996/g.56576  ORF Transcript_31996/g.56576 Transcript_31996/m.56576 type:complete len:302 (+) Transcript_31996:474-1379(+)
MHMRAHTLVVVVLSSCYGQIAHGLSNPVYYWVGPVMLAELAAGVAVFVNCLKVRIIHNSAEGARQPVRVAVLETQQALRRWEFINVGIHEECVVQRPTCCGFIVHVSFFCSLPGIFIVPGVILRGSFNNLEMHFLRHLHIVTYLWQEARKALVRPVKHQGLPCSAIGVNALIHNKSIHNILQIVEKRLQDIEFVREVHNEHHMCRTSPRASKIAFSGTLRWDLQGLVSRTSGYIRCSQRKAMSVLHQKLQVLRYIVVHIWHHIVIDERGSVETGKDGLLFEAGHELLPALQQRIQHKWCIV